MRTLGRGGLAFLAIGATCSSWGCGAEASSEGAWKPGYADIRGAGPAAMQVLQEKPENAFALSATIEIRCPAGMVAGTMGALGAGTGAMSGITTGSIVGGCTYDDALLQAKARATKLGAAGLFGVQTTAADNGKIVLLIATPYRLTAHSAAGDAAKGTGPAASPSPDIEQRLQRLLELRQKGLISAEDYEKRKAAILDEI